MKDIANQLILKWARQGNTRISVTEDFTRLTLDTIALCSMDYRFNSFYQESMHPFVDAMVNVLAESGSRSTRPALLNKMMYKANAKFAEDQKLMERISQEIVDHRRAHPVEKKDILNALIYGVDPKTEKTLRDELIIAQMITFLVAGQLIGYEASSRTKSSDRTRDDIRTIIIRILESVEEQPRVFDSSERG